MENMFFILGVVVLIAVYDVVIINRKGKKASISAWAIRIADKYPSIVFVTGLVIGFVFGHLFWRMDTLDIYECTDPYVENIIKECKVR